LRHNREQRGNHDWVETDNQDFTEIIMTSYKYCQLRHHEQNWRSLPRKVEGMIKESFVNIKPPCPDEELTQQLNAVQAETNQKVLEIVQKHLKKSIENNKESLARLNPADKDRALRIAYQRLAKNLGNRMRHEERNQLLAEADELLTYRQRNEESTATREISQEAAHQDRKEEGRTDRDEKDKEKSTTNGDVENGVEEEEQMEQGLTRKRGRPENTPTPEKNRPARNEEGAKDSATNLKGTTHGASLENLINSITETPTKKRLIRSSKVRLDDQLQNTNKNRISIHRSEGKAEWGIAPSEETGTVIIGDSNLKLARNIPEGTEVHCFPGLHFSHAAAILNKLHTDSNPLRVVIAAGINHRDHSITELDTELKRLKGAVGESEHEILVMGVPSSHSHGEDLQRKINLINGRLRTTYQNRYIEPIGRDEVTVAEFDLYGIHHNQPTTDKVIESILRFLD
jgi:DNA-binding FrmR family transcriptional regulator